MKKLEVILYIFAIVILAFLYKQEIIDEASIGLAVGLIAAVKGLVYQKDIINQERQEKEALQGQLRQKELEVKMFKAKKD